MSTKETNWGHTPAMKRVEARRRAWVRKHTCKLCGGPLPDAGKFRRREYCKKQCKNKYYRVFKQKPRRRAKRTL